MLTKADLLAEMNRDIPTGVDWKAGARAYVANCFEKYGRGPIERYSMHKPFNMMSEGADPRAAIAESVGYLRNLTNALAFLQLRGGSRILDDRVRGWMGISFAQQNGLSYVRRRYIGRLHRTGKKEAGSRPLVGTHCRRGRGPFRCP